MGRFGLVGDLYCERDVGPCRLWTLGNYALKPGRGPLEYTLQSHRGRCVKLVGYDRRQSAKSMVLDPLWEQVSLVTLSSLVDLADEDIVAWVSKWGLLGFQPQMPGWGKSLCDKMFKHFVPMLPSGETAEPLELIRDATKLARAGVELHTAIRLKDVKEQRPILEGLLIPRVAYYVGHNPKMFLRRPYAAHGIEVCEDDAEEYEIPRTDKEWSALGRRAMGSLCDKFLRNTIEPSYFPSRSLRRRGIEISWTIRPLISVLFLKLFQNHKARHVRVCEVCGTPIEHRYRHAKTCSASCKKYRQRH